MEIEKRKKFIINFAYIFIIVGLLYAAGKYAFPVVSPFLFAGLIAMILNKPIKYLTKVLKIKREIVAIVLLAVFYILIVTVMILIGIRIFYSIKDLFITIPQLYKTDVEPYLVALFEQIENKLSSLDPEFTGVLNEMAMSLLKSLGDSVSSISVWVVGKITGYATMMPKILVRILFTIIASIFMVVDYERITTAIVRQFNEKTKSILLDVKSYVANTLLACTKSYALIMMITFCELSVGLWLIGIRDSMLIALIIAFFDILPVLGTGTILIPWIIIALIQMDTALAIKLAVLYMTVTIIRNIIEPKIVGKQMGLHPLVTLGSIFIGAQLFGAVGLFGLPIFLSLLKYLNDKGTIHLFK